MDILVISGGRLIDPASGVDAIRSLVVREGTIAEVAERLDPPRDATVIDATGMWVTPGFIDLHVHLREPGHEYKETVESGARAAAAGGFTAVVAMPNTVPPNDNASVTELILRRALEAGAARVYPVGCISRGMKGEELAEYGELKAAGCVALSDDGRPVMSSMLMRRALEYAKAFQLPLTVHEEDLSLAGKGVMNEGWVATRLGLAGAPPQAEEVMVRRDIALTELTGGRLHIAHISTAGSVQAVREAKARGLPITAEVSPHHLTLTDEAVGRSGYDSDFKMNPPLRSEGDVEACRAAIADGTLDCIATDHAPHSDVEKQMVFDEAANGIVGLETAFAVCLRLVAQGALSQKRLIEALTAGPARAFGLAGGSLERGVPADIAILDPGASWRCDPARFPFERSQYSVEGETMVGQCAYTLVGGRVVYARPATGEREGRE